MAEYIDRDALLAEAKRISGPMTGDGWDNWGVYALINRQPAVDVQPVVRCINCKYYEGLACCKLIGDCGGTNWFCGWGKPKKKT